MKRLLSAATAAVVLAAIPLACDFEKTGNQIKAEKTMVATILGTPPIDISPAALSGFDGGTFDAGSIPPDSGISFDGGSVTLPPQTAAFVFWGERDNSSLDTPPDPLTGAKITVAAEGGPSFQLIEQDKGNYALTSQDDAGFEYKPRANYTFTVTYQGETFVGKVADAPELERVPDLHPARGYIEQPVNTPFTLHRPAPAGAERNLGFVTVFPVSDSGQQGEPSWTNIPDSPIEFLKLAARPGDWRKDTITVEASAFPAKNQTYLLVLQAVKLGGAESDNLFKASPILAGTAEVGVFRTK